MAPFFPTLARQCGHLVAAMRRRRKRTSICIKARHRSRMPTSRGYHHRHLGRTTCIIPSRVASLALLPLLPLDLDSEHHPVSYPCHVCSSCRLVVGRGFSLSSPPRSSCMSAVITLASSHRCLHNADLPACAPGAARASCFPWPGGLTSSPATPLHAALTSRRRPCTTFAPPVPVVCRCQPRQPSHRLTFTPAILTTTPARSGEGASDPVAKRGRGGGGIWWCWRWICQLRSFSPLPKKETIVWYWPHHRPTSRRRPSFLLSRELVRSVARVSPHVACTWTTWRGVTSFSTTSCSYVHLSIITCVLLSSLNCKTRHRVSLNYKNWLNSPHR